MSDEKEKGMRLDEIERVLAESSREDWVRTEELKNCVYKKDVNLRIESDFDSAEPFSESWATKLPDSNARTVEYTVWYGDTRVVRKTLVSVDGGRAELPMPKSATELVVDSASVNFARVVTIIDTVDEYLGKCGISVVPEGG